MTARAVIVAAGGANFGSLIHACRRVGVEAEPALDASRIRAATHVLLPGVGAAGHAMRALREAGLDRVLGSLRQPLLGICLGMQVLFEHSEEDETECLGLVPGRVRRLGPAPRWPNMGWSPITACAAHPLLGDDGDGEWFYFVHGYAAPVGADTIAVSAHGGPFSAAIARDNVFGVQFHPEKSSAAGRRLLSHFFAIS